MSFFDKVKQGASDAAKKAQQTVEITRLKSQISGKEKEMEKLYLIMGEAIYRAHESGDITAADMEIASFCEQLDAMKLEIQLLDERIRNIRFEKSCTCGKVVPLDARFCPDCGTELVEEHRPETTFGEIRVICSDCQTENALNAKVCVACGKGLSSDSAEETY
ncbi:zinc ribbon domain-containing protein [Paenibacillus oenotherae]|uniref:Zinc ribbon domain-containing protein n=1 Tax=Paenibacillus oenotherae TaxID=1435645 RepID=A0ABS7DAB0_9BACL|nr:zinc ribbon domain-containing protein [Paenibacillus oenotherae]MBW7476816.1 zinc ribbon domain-containing protein [Paenibacillus oenotherae]